MKARSLIVKKDQTVFKKNFPVDFNQSPPRSYFRPNKSLSNINNNIFYIQKVKVFLLEQKNGFEEPGSASQGINII